MLIKMRRENVTSGCSRDYILDIDGDVSGFKVIYSVVKRYRAIATYQFASIFCKKCK